MNLYELKTKSHRHTYYVAGFQHHSRYEGAKLN
jgi:hypothetical protein